MKVKEIERTANAAWSPQTHHPIYLAAGTAAQQLDATFSTTAAVELYKLNLGENSLKMPLVGSVASDHRFHKIVWGSHGMTGNGETPSGHLVGGADNGHILIWDPSKIIQQEEDCLVEELDKHSGAVTALDFNHFQHNLLASGGSDSEIYIWDLQKNQAPMTPGQKSQPPDDVSCIAWNHQVQHILASTFTSRCVVWDLRKNEPIVKISDSMSRIKSKLVAWHPDVATQMCLASEDDHTPVVQLWDLRFATSPLKVLENHQRGILAMSWCPQDPDLLMTCGKDNRILCWNPNSNVQGGEVIYELPTNNQWSFDIHWCPRNPAIISTCSFDGHIGVYSLMGGDSQPVTPTNKIADSFSTDLFSQAMASSQSTQQTSMPLKKAPKWLRKPVGAKFGFGGKLVTFDNPKPANPQQAAIQHQVYISQVVTETHFIARSSQLQSALSNSQYTEFCSMKIANSQRDLDENIWNFLKANFESEPRNQYLHLLGFDREDLSRKVSDTVAMETQSLAVDPDDLSQKIKELSTNEDSDWLKSDAFGGASSQPSTFDDITTSLSNENSRSQSPLPIAIKDDIDGLISQAVLVGDFECAVEMCLHDNRMAEAIILAVSGGPELLAQTQKKFFAKQKSNLSRLINSVVSKDWMQIVKICDLQNWKEALAIILTYSTPEELVILCDVLGQRLQTEGDSHLSINACLCYIVSGNVDRLVSCWAQSTSASAETPAALQDLVEKVMILRQAVELVQGDQGNVDSGPLAAKLTEYAGLLAAQGHLSTALTYLGSSQESKMLELRDRLYQCLGDTSLQAPSCPFNKVNVQVKGVAQVQPQGLSQPQPQPATYQSTARSQFSTTTTSSGYSYNTASYAGITNGMPQSYSQDSYGPTVPSSGSASYPSKGPLSHKYPSYPATSSVAHGYSTGYGQQTPYSSASGYSVTGAPYHTPATSMYGPQQSTMQGPGGPYTGQPAVSTPSLPHMPSYQEMKPHDGGWNDPPIVTNKPKTPTTTYESVPPMSIYNPNQAVNADQAPPGGPAQYSSFYNPTEHQPAPAPISPKTVEPPKPVEKGPIPNEHQVLKDIFDNLVNRCLGSTTNPQIKRKLEDVVRKLEALYDKLRSNSLSPNVTLGLHQIIQAIQAYDYQTGLTYYNQMVSQGNFSEISSFMPAIKMLMQSATQLQVYVQ